MLTLVKPTPALAGISIIVRDIRQSTFNYWGDKSLTAYGLAEPNNSSEAPYSFVKKKSG
jgi:hypothetical protein